MSYENPVLSPSMSSKSDAAKVVHKNATIALANRAGVPFPPFGQYTLSIMSRGTSIGRHHFITVWEALTVVTKNYIAPDEWEIE